MRLWVALVLGLVLVSACRLDCPVVQHWDEIEVELVDPGDEDLVEVGRRVALAMESFALWSGRDEVCLGDVQVIRVPSDDQTAGEYDVRDASLDISASSDDPWATTFHELCHAVDLDERISRAHPELFPEDSVRQDHVYTTRRGRTMEAFARICDEGAMDVDRLQIWEDQCGLPLGDLDLDAVELVQDTVFPQAPQPLWDSPREAIVVGEPWDPPAVEGVWNLDWLLPARDHLVISYNRRDHTERYFAFVDPADGVVLESYAIDPCAGIEHCRSRRFEGEEYPWLLVEAGEETWLWRLHPEGPVRVEIPCAGAEGWLEAGGVLWDISYDGIHGCSLEGGGQLDLPWPVPDFPLEAQWVPAPHWTFTRLGGQPALWWRGLGMAWLGPEEATWRTLVLPWYLGIESVAPLADGRWLLAIVERGDGSEAYQMTVLLLDPTTGLLTATDSVCPLPIQGHGPLRPNLIAGSGWAVAWHSLDPSEEPRVQPLVWD